MEEINVTLEKNQKIPSLPKIYRPTQKLATNKLGEQFYCKISNYDFETTRPTDFPLNYEYNSLNDTHLRNYFTRPRMLSRLKNLGFVNTSNEVICSVKSYHTFRQAMEHEARRDKYKNRNEVTVNEVTLNATKKQTNKILSERIEKVKEFQKKQDKAKMYMRHKIQKQLDYDNNERERRKQEQVEEKQRRESEREYEKERRLALLLQREHQELCRKRKIISKREYDEKLVDLRYRQRKQQSVLHHHAIIAQRFKRWDEHHASILDQQESMKRQIDEERKKNKEKRAKLFKILQNRQEITHQKLLEKNHMEAKNLLIEADNREKKWIEHRNEAVHCWQEHQEQINSQHRKTPPIIMFSMPTAPNVAKQLEVQEEYEHNELQQKQEKKCIKEQALTQKRVSCINKVQHTLARVLADRAIRNAVTCLLNEINN